MKRKRRCFWMQVDGQPVHVLTGGADVSELTEQDFEALRAIARAARRYSDALETRQQQQDPQREHPGDDP